MLRLMVYSKQTQQEVFRPTVVWRWKKFACHAFLLALSTLAVTRIFYFQRWKMQRKAGWRRCSCVQCARTYSRILGSCPVDTACVWHAWKAWWITPQTSHSSAQTAGRILVRLLLCRRATRWPASQRTSGWAGGPGCPLDALFKISNLFGSLKKCKQLCGTAIHHSSCQYLTFSPQEKQTKCVYCDYCPEKNILAVKTCTKCEVSLCKEHVKDHQVLPVFTGHPLVGPLSDLAERRCPQHKDEVLRYYCKSSRRYICSICTLEGKQLNVATETSTVLRRQLTVSLITILDSMLHNQVISIHSLTS